MPQEFEPASAEQTASSAPQTSRADPEAFAAAQRVTPEELHAALGALEGSPSRPLPAAGASPDAAHVPDTLSLGEAVDALGLPISPDELWQEVQQQRAEKERAKHDQAERDRARQEQARREPTHPPPFQQVPPLQTPSAFVGFAGRNSRFGNGTQRGGRRKWIGIVFALFLLSRMLYGHGPGYHAPLVPSFSGMAGSLSAVNEDGQTLTLTGTGGTAVVNGDGDTVTLKGRFDSLVVNGDGDTVHVRGAIGKIVMNGDAANVTYPHASTPSVTLNGSGDSAHAE